jgi:DNA-binding beta-propeller fold protein YncE
VLFTAWYLLFRKPIDEIIPDITIDKVPTYGFSIYGVQRPLGVAVSADGTRIYASESGGDRAVHVFDARGDETGRLAAPEAEGSSWIPVYLAIDPLTEDIYVSDRWAAAIHVYHRDGTYVGTFSPDPEIPDWQPLGLSFDSTGTLYVTDVGSTAHRVLVFDRDRKLVRTITVTDGFEFPNGLALDARGDVAVADGNNGRVVIVAADGSEVGLIPRGFAPGELALPRGTAIDMKNRLFVSDTTAHVVQIYKLDAATGAPTYLATMGHEGVEESGFEYPHGLALDSSGRVYVADWANDRIDVWTP